MPQQREIHIIVNEQGQVGINGHIKNKIEAYGMLEMARDLINEYHQQQAQRVQPATIDQLANLTPPGNG